MGEMERKKMAKMKCKRENDYSREYKMGFSEWWFLAAQRLQALQC